MFRRAKEDINLFGLSRKSKIGKIENEFKWLSLQSIGSNVDLNNLSPKDISTFLCRLAIFGGLDLKKTINEEKLLKNANPDLIVIECIGYTWSQVFQQCLKSSNVDIYQDEDLADAIYGCQAALHSVLQGITGRDIRKNLASPYPGHNLIASTEALTGRLLEIGGVEMLGDIKDNVLTSTAVNIYATTMLPGVIETSLKIITAYVDQLDY